MSALLPSPRICGKLFQKTPEFRLNSYDKHPPKPDNTVFIALSIAGAGLVVVGVSAGTHLLRIITFLKTDNYLQCYGMPVEQAPATLGESGFPIAKRRSL